MEKEAQWNMGQKKKKRKKRRAENSRRINPRIQQCCHCWSYDLS
jgi:hypothetical protein